MNVSYTQFTVRLLEDCDDGVSDRSELSSFVRRNALTVPVRTGVLPPIGSRETLEEGRQVVV
jgi:hypothetical protein